MFSFAALPEPLVRPAKSQPKPIIRRVSCSPAHHFGVIYFLNNAKSDSEVNRSAAFDKNNVIIFLDDKKTAGDFQQQETVKLPLFGRAPVFLGQDQCLPHERRAAS
jgi:hypothetical protein